LWKRIFKSIKAIRRKEIKTNVGKTDGFSIPLSAARTSMDVLGHMIKRKKKYSKIKIDTPVLGQRNLDL